MSVESAKSSVTDDSDVIGLSISQHGSRLHTPLSVTLPWDSENTFWSRRESSTRQLSGMTSLDIPTFVGSAQIYLSPDNRNKPLSVEDLSISSSFSKPSHKSEWRGSPCRDGLDEGFHSSVGGLLTTGSPLRTSSAGGVLTTGSPLRTSPAFLHRTPVKGLHDTSLSINTYTNGIDADSGISSRTLRTPSHDVTSIRSRHSGFSDTSSPGLASRTRCSSPAPNRLSSDRKVRDLKGALDDSEKRRDVLRERLRDAQDTIQLQTKRLNQVENVAKDTSFEADDLRYKTKEYRHRIEALEKSKENEQSQRIENLRAREQLLQRVEDLDSEVRSMKTQTTLLKMEGKKKQSTIESLTNTVALMEKDNTKLLEGKESLEKEISTLKESLNLSRTRSEWLEGYKHENKEELQRLRTETGSLNNDRRSLISQIVQLKASNKTLAEENKTLRAQIETLEKEKNKFGKEVEKLRSDLTEMKSTLSCTSSEKERFFQEKLELHQRISSLSCDRESLLKAKGSLDEQLAESSNEIEVARAEITNLKAERKHMHEELEGVKKVSEVLSKELAGCRGKLEKQSEQYNSLEQTKKLAFQQHSLYEQEIQSLERQLQTLKKSMEQLRKDHTNETEVSEKKCTVLKEELRICKAERNEMDLKIHELETKVKRSEQNLTEHSNMQLHDLETWQSSCEKLTASLSRNEMELSTLLNKVQDLEKENGFLKVNNATYQDQFEDMTETRDELSKVKDENRRLVQERAENQQVIQLLEMQKDILSKTSEGSLGKIYDAEKLQCKIEQLTTEKQNLQDQLDNVKRKFADFKLNQEPTLNATTNGIGEKVTELKEAVERLENVNKKIAEKLTLTEHENNILKMKQEEVIPKAEYVKLRSEKESVDEELKYQKVLYGQIEENHQLVLADKKKGTAGDPGTKRKISKLEEERENLQSEVTMLNSKVTLLESDKRRTEEESCSLQHQVDLLKESATKYRAMEHNQTEALTVECKELKDQLRDAKAFQAQQEELIQTLREKSLDDVGEELTHMRTELQKLMEVIQVKDQAIEDLETQLKVMEEKVSQKNWEIDDIKRQSASDKRGPTALDLDGVDGDLGKLANLEKEKQELCTTISQLTKERDSAQQEAVDLREGMDDLQDMFDGEKSKLLGKLKKELAAKDRQIESLEEQLRNATRTEIKKLKRDAGRIELLSAENRVLRNRLSQASPKYSNLVPINPTKSNKSDSLETKTSKPFEYGDRNIEALSPSSIDNEIQSVAKELQEEKEFETQENLRRGYNLDSVTDSEEADLYEVTSQFSLQDNLSAELLEERNAFEDSNTTENRPNLDVAIILGTVGDLGSTLKFPPTDQSMKQSGNNSVVNYNGVSNGSKEKDVTKDDLDFLSDSTLSESEDYAPSIGIKEKKNRKGQTPKELDLDLTGLNSNSSDEESNIETEPTNKTLDEGKTTSLLNLLKKESSNMSRALLLAESGYLEDKVTGQSSGSSHSWDDDADSSSVDSDLEGNRTSDHRPLRKWESTQSLPQNMDDSTAKQLSVSRQSSTTTSHSDEELRAKSNSVSKSRYPWNTSAGSVFSSGEKSE